MNKYNPRLFMLDLRAQRRKLAHTFKRSPFPNLWWPTDYKYVTQGFGLNPPWYIPFGIPAHGGLDMRAPTGTPIRAVWNGIVTRADKHSAYGHHIRLSHTIRGIEYGTLYAHFMEPSPWKVGDVVERAQLIGLANNSGNSYGSHLHFGMIQLTGEKPNTYYQNKYVWPHNIIDPTQFFKETREGYV